MWYLCSVFWLFLSVAACTLLGRSLLVYTPWRLRSILQAFFAPIIGLSAYILISALFSWLGAGFAGIALPVTVLLSAAAVVHQRRKWRDLPRVALLMAGAVMVLPAAMFFCVLRFQAFTPFNDAFTYLVQAQWLQHHGFNTPAAASAYFPALTQVLFYQRLGFRMGGSFYFGWLQGMILAPWSYTVYPAAITTPIVAGCFALAGAIYSIVKRHRAVCLLAGAMAGVSLNNWTYGSVFGFLSQTYGLALGFSLLVMVGIALSRYPGQRLIKGSRAGFAALPVALTTAALISSYPELLAFVGLGLAGAVVLLCLLRRHQFRILAAFGVWIALETLLLVNLEIFRTFRTLKTELAAAVGASISWTVPQAFYHTIGFASGPWEGTPLLSAEWLTLPLALAVIAAAFYGLWRFRRRVDPVISGMVVSLTVVLAIAYVYFLFFAISPWTHNTGHAWNEMRSCGWAILPNLFVIGAGLGLLYRYAPSLRIAVLALLGVWAALSLHGQYELAQGRTGPMIHESGYGLASFELKHDLEDLLTGIPRDQPVDLNSLSPGHVKLRQFLSYVLMDRPVAGNWTGDTYVDYWLLHLLNSDQRATPPSVSPFGLAFAERNGGVSLLPRVGNIGLVSLGPMLIPAGATGDYPTESDASGSWHWMKNELTLRFRAVDVGDGELTLRFGAGLPGGEPRTLNVAVQNAGETKTFTIDLKPGYQKYTLPPFKASNGIFDVRFSSAAAAHPISASDGRLVVAMIKDVEGAFASSAATPVAGLPTANVRLNESPAQSSQLAPVPPTDFTARLVGVKGGYDKESDSSGEWRWTRDVLRYEFDLSAVPQSGVRVVFAYQPATKPGVRRLINLRLMGAADWSYQIANKSGWYNFESPAVPAKDGRLIVEVLSPEPPISLGTADVRQMAFLIKNLKILAATPAASQK